MAVMAAAAVFWLLLRRRVQFSGVNLQCRGSPWIIPLKLTAFPAARGITAYLVTRRTRALIEYFELVA